MQLVKMNAYRRISSKERHGVSKNPNLMMRR